MPLPVRADRSAGYGAVGGELATPDADDLDGRLAAANQLQASKVKALMRSIDQLQKENQQLRRRSQEPNRTGQFKQLQAELGRQDTMIEALRCCIGDEQARELVRSAMDFLARRSEDGVCVSCKLSKEELFEADDGAVYCRSCYSSRFWQPPDVARRLEVGPQSTGLPATKDELQKELDALARQLANLKRALKKERESQETAADEVAVKEDPKLVAFTQTAAALTNLMAGYEHRARLLEQENTSLDAQRAQLERAVEQQGQLARQQLQQQLSAVVEYQRKKGTSAAEHAAVEDLETRLRLRENEIQRLGKVVAEVQQRLSIQDKKRDTLLKEKEEVQVELKKLHSEVSRWARKEEEEHAGRLEKLRQSSERVHEGLRQSRDRLKEARAESRQGLGRRQSQREALETKASEQRRADDSKLDKELQALRASSRSAFRTKADVRLAALERAEKRRDAARAEADSARLEVEEAKREEVRCREEELQIQVAAAAERLAGTELETEANRKLQLSETDEAKRVTKLMAEHVAELQQQLKGVEEKIAAGRGADEAAAKAASEARERRSEDAALRRSVEGLREEIDDLRRSQEKERAAAQDDLDRLHAAAEHCSGLGREGYGGVFQGPPAKGGPSDVPPLPTRLLLTAPGTSAAKMEELAQARAEAAAEAEAKAAAEALRKEVWARRWLPVEEQELPALSLNVQGDAADEAEMAALEVELVRLRTDLSSTRAAAAAVGEAVELQAAEEQVRDLEAMQLHLEEDVNALREQLQAAQLFLRRKLGAGIELRAATGGAYCDQCPHCFFASPGASVVSDAR
eukprot:TRINITY_DN26967_c0_g1_i1.p1 TRINITY_DN26967_c0_g1~~TRINITY_DN26967_c0_g1_i1.p1  ORF type:complete len:808 (+),score=274.89 TRINITY_DN26967_c0_g1_i1:120-2543(+)